MEKRKLTPEEQTLLDDILDRTKWPKNMKHEPRDPVEDAYDNELRIRHYMGDEPDDEWPPYKDIK